MSTAKGTWTGTKGSTENTTVEKTEPFNLLGKTATEKGLMKIKANPPQSNLQSLLDHCEESGEKSLASGQQVRGQWDNHE